MNSITDTDSSYNSDSSSLDDTNYDSSSCYSTTSTSYESDTDDDEINNMFSQEYLQQCNEQFQNMMNNFTDYFQYDEDEDNDEDTKNDNNEKILYKNKNIPLETRIRMNNFSLEDVD